MQVLVYPANYDGPSPYGDGFVVPLHRTLDRQLADIFEVAAMKSCQWVQFFDKPLVRDETKWVNI